MKKKNIEFIKELIHKHIIHFLFKHLSINNNIIFKYFYTKFVIYSSIKTFNEFYVYFLWILSI